MPREELESHHLMAINFLSRVGQDCVGEVDSEETLAGALTYIQLKTLGLVYSVPSPQGPIWRLTQSGIDAALQEQTND